MHYKKVFEFEANEAFVELRFTEGTCLRVDRRGAEAGFVRTSRDRAALDTLAYNDPFTYVQLMLYDDLRAWLKKRS